MTKQRHCFVTQVGDAIEALASALDPERKPPFKGNILDLLEWAEKDVLAMLDITWSSLIPGAGHIMTLRDHVCGEFIDTTANAEVTGA